MGEVRLLGLVLAGSVLIGSSLALGFVLEGGWPAGGLYLAGPLHHVLRQERGGKTWGPRPRLPPLPLPSPLPVLLGSASCWKSVMRNLAAECMWRLAGHGTVVLLYTVQYTVKLQ